MNVYRTSDIMSETGQQTVRAAAQQLAMAGAEIYRYNEEYVIAEAHGKIQAEPVLELTGSGLYYAPHGIISEGLVLESAGFDIIRSTKNHIALRAIYNADILPVTSRPLVFR